MKIDALAAEDLFNQLCALARPAPPPKKTKKTVGLILGILLTLIFAGFGYAVWKVPTAPGPEYTDLE